jgi:hypothetical protein
MRMARWISLVVLAACGGGQKHTTTTAQPENPCAGDQMCSPELIEEIQRSFRARRSVITRCYGDASIAGKLKNPRAKGRVTVLSHITTAGRATSAKVSDTTLDEPVVEACIVAHVLQWEIPKPDVDIDFSFTYDVQPD